ncbi:type I restriction-modification system subunit M [Dysgonomonas termitidis]|uniref:site-specific DNA-methyltransferase (adenine-specific) n=1 Tax=Dysgonomonas termitidis TaxID=1516126 RepID=A0ABV9KT25_9BACT
MNKQQLASKIWASANKMRSKIEANDYKDYILGFIFYKFLSDKEESLLRKSDWTQEDFPELKEDDEETVRYCQQQLGYFISYNNLFSTWLKKGRDFDVSDVRDAISAFNRLINETHKPVFAKIFDTLQTGLSKLGESAGSQTKAISQLIQLIKDIPTDGSQDYDVLGFIYEYLISNFAANAGKKAGEFYTPHEVSVLMSEIVAHYLKDRDKIEIYDPTSGSGSLLINIGRSVAKHISNKDNILYYAQELKENTYNLTRMNLVMRDILPDNIKARNGDTLEDDWPYFDETDKERTYSPLYVDAVVSNPPYSQNWDPSNKEADARYSRYGLAPKAKADYAFLLHDLFHVKPDGIMTIVLPHGVLFRGGEEEKIRKNLIEYNNIDAIIGLPSNIFFGTGIPTIIMVLRQQRADEDVLIIDASKGFVKEGKNNKLRACDIKKIADAIINRSDIPKFSRKVSRKTIRENGYNLNIPRYVDSSAEAESWDIYASMFGGIPNAEIDALANYWAAFPTLRAQLFANDGTPYSSLSAEDVKQTIADNADVKSFINRFNEAFATLPAYLKEELIDNMLTLKIQQEENKISIDIFNRLTGLPLFDKYWKIQ